MPCHFNRVISIYKIKITILLVIWHHHHIIKGYIGLGPWRGLDFLSIYVLCIYLAVPLWGLIGFIFRVFSNLNSSQLLFPPPHSASNLHLKLFNLLTIFILKSFKLIFINFVNLSNYYSFLSAIWSKSLLNLTTCSFWIS